MENSCAALMMKSRLTVIVVLVAMIHTVCAAPAEETSATQSSSSTQSPFPVATVKPWVKQQPLTRYEQGLQDYDEAIESNKPSRVVSSLYSDFFSPSQLVLTVMRTLVDVLQKVNQKRTESKKTQRKAEEIQKKIVNATEKIDDKRLEYNITSGNGSKNATARGMDHLTYEDFLADHYPEHLHHVVETTTTTTEAPKEMMKPRYSDPWAGYYDFIITEGSFKFWSLFQLATAGLLLYSALAAIYFAKFNPIQPDYDTSYDDYFFGRSLEGGAPAPAGDSAGPAPGWLSGLAGMGARAYQRIMETVASADES